MQFPFHCNNEVNHQQPNIIELTCTELQSQKSEAKIKTLQWLRVMVQSK